MNVQARKRSRGNRSGRKPIDEAEPGRARVSKTKKSGSQVDDLATKQSTSEPEGHNGPPSITVGEDQVVSIPWNEIDALLDDPNSEVCPGVFIAPIFKSQWVAVAQVQIEPLKSHGPHINSAEYLVGRVFAASSEGIYLDIRGAIENQLIKQDEYFQVPKGAIYALHNRSTSTPVVLNIQVFSRSSQ